jgi:enoyl-CoA hydratase/carnithine racemase
MSISGNRERVRLASGDGIARLTLMRGDRYNAIDTLMLEEMLKALATVGHDQQIRVLIVDAEGKAFCSGVDLDDFMQDIDASSGFTNMKLLDRHHELIRAVYELPQVTIAAIQGAAIGGGGFGLAMACDLRFAVRTAEFWLVPASLNVVQDFGLTWFLQRSIGTHRTFEMAFTGQRVDAAVGERWGFLNGVFESVEEMKQHVETVSRSVAEMGPDAARLLKHVIRSGSENSLRDQLKLESISNGLCFQSAEFRQSKERFFGSLRKGGH